MLLPSIGVARNVCYELTTENDILSQLCMPKESTPLSNQSQ